MTQILTLLNWFMGNNAKRGALWMGLASIGLLIGALMLQHIWKVLPCDLCYWQRKPHMIIAVLGVLGFLCRNNSRRAVLFALLALAAFVNAGLAGFHTGVEYHWWKGLPTCSTPTEVTTTLEQARALIFSNSTIIPCDEPSWSFLGLSLTMWNGVISLIMGAWAVWGFKRSRNPL